MKKTILVPPTNPSTVQCNPSRSDTFSYEGPIIIQDTQEYVPSSPTQSSTSIDSSKFFQVENLFSELTSDQQKYLARENLGITSGSWGDIIGEIEDQEDLVSLIRNLVYNKLDADYTDKDSTINKIAYVSTLPDLKLNSDYTKAINAVLDGGDVQSLKDVLDILMYTLFPVVYTDWSLNVSIKNTINKSIETGTFLSINPDDSAGTIVIDISPGNKGDIPKSLTVGGEDILTDVDGTLVTHYEVPIKVRNITNETQLKNTVSKTFDIVLETDLPNTITLNKSISITITNFSYYFYYGITNTNNGVRPDIDFETINDLIQNGVKDSDTWKPGSNVVRTTKNTGIFDLGTSSTFLYAFSYKTINTVTTKAGNSPAASVSFTPKTIKYTPQGAKESRTYYWVTLSDPQINKVSITLT